MIIAHALVFLLLHFVQFQCMYQVRTRATATARMPAVY